MKRTIFILATLLGMTGMSEAVAQTTMSIIPGVSVENFNMNQWQVPDRYDGYRFVGA